MRKLYALAILTFTAVAAYAQGPLASAAADGSISGVVIDSASNKPVEFATVALMEGTSDKPVNGAVCDEKGKFEIKKVAPGKYTIVISFIGYSSKSISVTVRRLHPR